MRLISFALAALISLGALSHAQPGHAQTDDARFDVIFRGFKAGQLVFRARQDGTSYQVVGKLQSTGFVGRLVEFSYDAQSSGTLRGTRYTPSQYTEQAVTGRGAQSSVMRYRAGVPQVREVTPARDPAPWDLSPAQQGGTVDILTALYATLRDQPRANACAVDLIMFDGRRRTSLTLSNPVEQAGGGVTCTGEYRRLGGFHPDDMAERTRFAFTMQMEPVGDVLRVMEISTPTLWGDAYIRRR